MRQELEELLSEHRFAPFVVTTNDGFAIAIQTPRRTLLSRNMLVVTDEEGNLYHLPFSGIAHLSEPKQT